MSVGDRLTASNRLVVLGDPGAGKTTLTRWIATAYLLKLKADPDWKDLPDVQTLPDTDWLPIIVRCRDLDGGRSADSLEDMLRHTLRRTELGTNEVDAIHAYLLHEIQSQRALLILDGLDEITEPLNRTRFCERIDAIVTVHPNLPIIATSRIVGYREIGRRLGHGFEHLTLADLTREEKDEFARRWSGLTEIPGRQAAAADELIADIHSTDRIERLTGNPMLLTTMALVKRRVGKLPQRRADLYWEAVQVLLNWRREVDAPIDHREAIPQLEYLAYAMCDRGVQRLRQDEVLELLARMRAEYPNVHAVQSRSAEDFLRVLEFRTGMLVEMGHERYRGRPVPVYEFRHLTFQEYLAALALVDGRFPGRRTELSLAQNVAPLAGRTTGLTARSRLLNSVEPVVVESWREALRLCVSICNDDDVDSVLKAILHPLNGEPKATRSARLLQVAACLADEPNASVDTATEIAKVFAAQSEERELARPSGLSRAAIELANTRWASIFIDSLTTTLFGCLATRREVVGLVLGAIFWGSSMSPAARQEWYRDRREEIRDADERAAAAAILSLIWGITTNAPPSAQGVAAALIKRLDGSAPVAHAAAWALALLSGAPWRFATARRLRSRWKPTVAQRRAIVAHLRLPEKDGYALGWLSTLSGSAGINDAIEPLKDFLQSRDSQLALRAVQALGRLGGTVTSEALIDTLIRDARPAVRAGAARALGQMTGEAAMTALTERLHSETDVNVRNDIFGSIAAQLPETDRRLVSRDFDGLMPFLKVQDAIEPSRITEAAKRVHLSARQVQARFEEFSKKFGLRFNW